MWKALQRFNFPFQFLAPGYILNSYKLFFINFIPKQISKHIVIFKGRLSEIPNLFTNEEQQQSYGSEF